MPLTDAKARSAKPTDKTYRLFDAHGLYLEVAPSGGKWWRFKYRFGGKEKRLSLGVYPEVGLKQARERLAEVRQQLAEDIDPGAQRKAQKVAGEGYAVNSFKVVAEEWYAKQESQWKPGHARTVYRRLELNVYPWLGMRPINDIKAPELLDVLRRVEARGANETAHRIKVICGQIFRYAIVTGRAERDPSVDLRDALTPVRPKHLPAITEPDKVSQLLRMIDAYEGSHVVKCALRLAPLVFVRPGELRQARWEEIDLESAEWRFEASKTETQHIVPLSTQAVAILRDLQALTGQSQWVFPSARTHERPMSDNAILAAFRRMGIGKDEMTGHGFRAMARTILDEVLGERVDLIEHQLAHKVKDPLGRAYNRTKHLPERRAMMQRWADYLEFLVVGQPSLSAGEK